MPFSRPTLTALQNQGFQDIINYDIPGQTALLRMSPLRAMNIANSGLIWGNYQYIDYVSQQCVPFTSTGENLLAWGGLVNVLPNPAISADDGSVTFFGTSGTVIPAGTQLVGQGGVRYITTQSGVIQQSGNSNTNGGNTGIKASCLSVGVNGNLPTNAALSLVTPISGVSSTVSVFTAFTRGVDIEDEELYRSRVLYAFRNPPQGGSLSDYAQWALSVPGVTRAWSLNGELGAGDVYVYFMADEVNQSNNGFPIGSDGVSTYELRFPPNTTTFELNGNSNSTMVTATGDQKTVADYIYPLREATAYIVVKAPTASAVNFTFSTFYPPDQIVFNNAYFQLQQYFQRVGTPYGITQTGPGTDDQTGTYYESDWFAALEATPGLVNFSLSSPTANITTSAGQLPVVGLMTPPPNVGLKSIGSSSPAGTGTGGVGSGGSTGGGSGGSTPPQGGGAVPVPGQIQNIEQYFVSNNIAFDPSTTVSVEWQPPSYAGSDTLSYVVLNTFDGLTYNQLQNSTATFATVSGMQPLTSVTLIVTAVTSHGISGPQSAPYTFRTQQGSNLGGGTGTGGIAGNIGPAQNLTVGNTGVGRFSLYWEPPIYGTGPFAYQIMYVSNNQILSGVNSAGIFKVLTSTSLTSYTSVGWESDLNDTVQVAILAYDKYNATSNLLSNIVKLNISMNATVTVIS